MNTRPQTNIDIVICDKCRGSGLTRHEELTNYHKREYDTWTTPCKTCEGSGRIEITTVTTRKPYAQPEPSPR